MKNVLCQRVCVLMVRTYYLLAEFSLDGLPHCSKQPRKPANEGTELKSRADVKTGATLRLELQESKDVGGRRRKASTCGHSIRYAGCRAKGR
eukprot:scaffold2474_cov234-Ochromonas_danica.AAC.1